MSYRWSGTAVTVQSFGVGCCLASPLRLHACPPERLILMEAGLRGRVFRMSHIPVVRGGFLMRFDPWGFQRCKDALIWLESCGRGGGVVVVGDHHWLVRALVNARTLRHSRRLPPMRHVDHWCDWYADSLMFCDHCADSSPVDPLVARHSLMSSVRDHHEH